MFGKGVVLFMFSNVRYVFWFIATLAINYSSIPFAIWLAQNNESSFPGKEMVSIILVLLVNIGSVQIFLAIRHKQSKNYIYGLYAIMGVLISFLVLAQLERIIYFIVLLSISLLTSIVLLMLLLKNVKREKQIEEIKLENEYKRPNPKPVPQGIPKKKQRKKRTKPKRHK